MSALPSVPERWVLSTDPNQTLLRGEETNSDLLKGSVCSDKSINFYLAFITFSTILPVKINGNFTPASSKPTKRCTQRYLKLKGRNVSMHFQTGTILHKGSICPTADPAPPGQYRRLYNTVPCTIHGVLQADTSRRLSCKPNHQLNNHPKVSLPLSLPTKLTSGEECHRI